MTKEGLGLDEEPRPEATQKRELTLRDTSKIMTQTIRDIIGHEFDGERVEKYIESELAVIWLEGKLND